MTLLLPLLAFLFGSLMIAAAAMALAPASSGAIARRLGELVTAARERRLAPEDVRGGTFTISNHGVSGSILAAPIVINQPQVASLGVGKVERRVVVDDVDGEEVFRIRSMCYLTLTIDHRALDGYQGNTFLSAVVNALESWPIG